MLRLSAILLLCLHLCPLIASAQDAIEAARARYATTIHEMELELAKHLEGVLHSDEESDSKTAAKRALRELVRGTLDTSKDASLFPEKLRLQFESTWEFEYEKLLASLESEVKRLEASGQSDRAQVVNTRLGLMSKGQALPGLDDAFPGQFRTARFTWGHGGAIHTLPQFPLPDVLTASIEASRLRIEGERALEDVRREKRMVGHLGKAALVKADDARGYLNVDISSGADSTSYFLLFLKQNDVIVKHLVWLDRESLYSWKSTKTEAGFLKLSLSKDEKPVASLSVRSDPELWMGFAATVRHQNEKADLSVFLMEQAEADQP